MAPPRLLAFRPREPADDDYIRALSVGAFAAFAKDGGRAVRGMMRESGTRTEMALLDDEPVGFAVLALSSPVRQNALIASTRAAHLCAIATDPELRRRGIGGQLLARAEQLARDEGAMCLTLTTAIDNTPARRLFTGAGYLSLASVDDFYQNGQPGLFMIKVL